MSDKSRLGHKNYAGGEHVRRAAEAYRLDAQAETKSVILSVEEVRDRIKAKILENARRKEEAA